MLLVAGAQGLRRVALGAADAAAEPVALAVAPAAAAAPVASPVAAAVVAAAFALASAALAYFRTPWMQHARRRNWSVPSPAPHL